MNRLWSPARSSLTRWSPARSSRWSLARWSLAALLGGFALALAGAAGLPDRETRQGDPSETTAQPGGGGGRETTRREADPAGNAPTTISLDFRGGALEAYVKAVRDAAGAQPVNVVVSGEADIAVPAVSLNRASVMASVALLEHLVVQGHEIEVSGTPDGGGEPVYIVRIRKTSPLSAGNDPNRSYTDLAVFSLRSLLETPGIPGARARADDLLTAMETALKMADDAPGAEMKFHPESGVLVIRGTPAQTSAVQRLLSEVKDDLAKVGMAAHQAAERESQLQHEIRMAEVQVGMAGDELRLSEQVFSKIQEVFNAGQASDIDRNNAEMDVSRRRGQLEQARIKLERANDAYRLWKSGAPAGGGGGGGALTPDQLRQEIKRAEAMLNSLRDDLKKLEAAGGGGRPAR